MVRLTATEVARSFSTIVNRVGAGEQIEVVRNGVPVVEMRPSTAGRLTSAQRWRELMANAPAVDEGFSREIEEARERLEPSAGAWPS